MTAIRFSHVEIIPAIEGGELKSLGAVRMHGKDVRNAANRFLPWFDTYEGQIFRTFRHVETVVEDDATRIVTKAVGDPDYPFIERRDSSGDICLRPAAWDEAPVESELRIGFRPAAAEIDGHAFHGFTYWFEYANPAAPIHRLMDRQTWEIGGRLDGVSLACRNLFDVPYKRLSRDAGFSTVGLDKAINVLPGNLWARWSLLPAFDMQTSPAGTLVAWFDRVSCIRSALQTNPGEDWLRVVDLHYFEQSGDVRTNPKTVLFCPDALSEVDAVNLWTRLYDQEYDKARAQFGFEDREITPVVVGKNVWRGIDFDTTYEDALELAAELGADAIFIDPLWQHGEDFDRMLKQLVPEERRAGTVLEKLCYQNTCCTFDLEVSTSAGGEAGLKRLCDRARAKGVSVLAWFAAHMTPRSVRIDRHDKEAQKRIATKESGRHPDTGYAGECWTLNLNDEFRDWVFDQVRGVCERTGLQGYLWDSFSNLGWWQVDYGDGSMRPQFDHMGRLYAKLVNAGVWLTPEGVVSFTRTSCCGLHGGDTYGGEALPYAYAMNASAGYRDPATRKQVNPLTDLFTRPDAFGYAFRRFAHKWIFRIAIQSLPLREAWHPEAVQKFKDLIAVYKRYRHLMEKRTVLPGDQGVLWEAEADEVLLFAFQPHERAGTWRDALTDDPVTDGRLQAERVYVGRRS